MSVAPYRFCPQCATALAPIVQDEDGGPKERLRCAACGFTHWNNPTPVLAASVECADRGGLVLLARGEIRLSPELAEYKLFAPADIVCWPGGTGLAVAKWLRARGYEPRFFEWPKPAPAAAAP